MPPGSLAREAPCAVEGVENLKPAFRLELREALGVPLAAVIDQVLEASEGNDEGDHSVPDNGAWVLRKEAHTWSGAGS
jgi:hypothetical protein